MSTSYWAVLASVAEVTGEQWFKHHTSSHVTWLLDLGGCSGLTDAPPHQPGTQQRPDYSMLPPLTSPSLSHIHISKAWRPTPYDTPALPTHASAGIAAPVDHQINYDPWIHTTTSTTVLLTQPPQKHCWPTLQLDALTQSCHMLGADGNCLLTSTNKRTRTQTHTHTHTSRTHSKIRSKGATYTRRCSAEPSNKLARNWLAQHIDLRLAHTTMSKPLHGCQDGMD